MSIFTTAIEIFVTGAGVMEVGQKNYYVNTEISFSVHVNQIFKEFSGILNLNNLLYV